MINKYTREKYGTRQPFVGTDYSTTRQPTCLPNKAGKAKMKHDGMCDARESLVQDSRHIVPCPKRQCDSQGSQSLNGAIGRWLLLLLLILLILML
jgi:hypothetical protein